MSNHPIIVIGASSGGIEALSEVVKGIETPLNAAIFVVQHLSPHSVNYLSTLLASHTTIATQTAAEGASIEPNHLYVAPADQHLLLDRDQMFLSRGPRENRTRPTIDPLFRSAALSHGSQVIGVVLSGSLDDGSAGMAAIKQAGGISVIQDPDDAQTPDMPLSVQEYAEIDHCLPADEIGPLLNQLAKELAQTSPQFAASRDVQLRLEREVSVLRDKSGVIATAEELGELQALSCPDCGGPLWKIDDSVDRYRCHTGHAFTVRHLVAGLQEAEEEALWVALRVMQERVRMLQRLSKLDKRKGKRKTSNGFALKKVEAETHVRHLRNLLESRDAACE